MFPPNFPKYWKQNMKYKRCKQLLICFILFQQAYLQIPDPVFTYIFTQCICLSDNPVLPETSQFPVTNGFEQFSLLKSSISTCPQITGFHEASHQGILIDANESQSSFSALISANSYDSLGVASSQGFTFEFWVNASSFENPAETTVSVLLDWASDEDLSTLGSFLCAIKTNPGRFIEGIYASSLMDDDASIRFDLNSIDDFTKLHVTCGVRLSSGSLFPFFCLNGQCEQDEDFELSVAEVNALNGKISLGLSAQAVSDFDNRLVSSVNIFSFQSYALGLTDENVVDLLEAEGVFFNYPVPATPSRLVFTEDVGALAFRESLFFDFDASGSNFVNFTLLNSSFGSLSSTEDILFSEADTVFTPAANVFTSTSNCVDDTDFFETYSFTVFDENALASCVVGANTVVEICITSVNDAPEFLLEDIVVQVVDDAENPVSFTFIPGTDVDDPNNEGLDGGLVGGAIVLNVAELKGQVSTCDGPFEPLETGDQVSIGLEGFVQLCFLRGDTLDEREGAVGSTELKFAIVDEAGSTTAGDAEGTVIIEVRELLVSCQNTCDFTINENTELEITLDGENIRGDPVIYTIEDLPRNGALTTLEGEEILSTPFTLVDADSVVYTPSEFYFNENEEGGTVDGLGDAFCPDDQDSCPDTFTFGVGFGNSKIEDQVQVTVRAVNNPDADISSVGIIAVGTNNEASLGSISIDPKTDSDMFPVTLIISAISGVYITYAGENVGDDTEREFTDYPSNLNEFLAESTVHLGTVGDRRLQDDDLESGSFSLSVQDGERRATAIVRVQLAEEESGSSGPSMLFLFGGAGVAALLVLMFGSWMGSKLKRRRRRRNLYHTDADDEEEHEMKVVGGSDVEKPVTANPRQRVRDSPNQKKARKGSDPPDEKGKMKTKNAAFGTGKSKGKESKGGKNTAPRNGANRMSGSFTGRRSGRAPPPNRLSRNIEKDEKLATESEAPASPKEKGKKDKIVLLGTFPNITYVKTTETDHI
eukprot:augustus_masked-scaffold_8-processed-gene-0.34-mRNA-1 protein AED:1.00 eAED:1.00 QI:0/-1/0/0/-1/1/1/0/991